jgi:hypothetical protein
LNGHVDRFGVAWVGRIESAVEHDERSSHETRYFTATVPQSPGGASLILVWGQSRWSIENRSHYVRDVTLGEDPTRIRTGPGPEIMAALRNAAMGFLRLTGATNIAETPAGNASES